MSKVKITRQINDEMENVPDLPKGRLTNFKLGIRMEYDDPHQRHQRSPLWI